MLTALTLQSPYRGLTNEIKVHLQLFRIAEKLKPSRFQEFRSLKRLAPLQKQLIHRLSFKRHNPNEESKLDQSLEFKLKFQMLTCLQGCQKCPGPVHRSVNQADPNFMLKSQVQIRIYELWDFVEIQRFDGEIRILEVELIFNMWR